MNNPFFMYDAMTGKNKSAKRRRQVEQAEDAAIQFAASMAAEELVGNCAGCVGGPAARIAGGVAGFAAGAAAGQAVNEFRRRNR